MIIYLSGNDAFRLRQRREFLASAAQKKFSGAATQIVEAGLEEDVAEILSRVSAPSLFSNATVLVINDAHAAAKAVLDFLKHRASQIKAPDFILIINQQISDDEPVQELNEYLRKNAARTEEFSALAPAAFQSWLGQCAKEKGVAIEPAALEYLVRASMAGDMPAADQTWRAVQNLERCASFQGQEPITLSVAQALVPAPAESRIFGLLDAITARAAGRALRALAKEYAAGSNDFMILTMFQYQLRLLALARAALDEKKTADLAAAAKLKPFVAQKALAGARAFKRPEILKLYEALADTHLALRRSQVSPRALVERFVIQFAAGI